MSCAAGHVWMAPLLAWQRRSSARACLHSSHKHLRAACSFATSYRTYQRCQAWRTCCTCLKQLAPAGAQAEILHIKLITAQVMTIERDGEDSGGAHLCHKGMSGRQSGQPVLGGRSAQHEALFREPSCSCPASVSLWKSALPQLL